MVTPTSWPLSGQVHQASSLHPGIPGPMRPCKLQGRKALVLTLAQRFPRAGGASRTCVREPAQLQK